MTLLTMMSLCASLILLLACVQMFRRCERLENRIEYRAGMEALHSDIAKKLSGHVKCLDEDTPEALFNAALKDFAQKCTKAVEEITL